MRQRHSAHLALVLALTAVAPALRAQARFGFYGGAVFANFGGSQAADLDMRSGGQGGLFVLLPFSDRIALRLGMAYLQKGAREDIQDVRATYSFSYFEVPVAARVNILSNEKFAFHALGGVAVGFNVVCEFGVRGLTASGVAACDSPLFQGNLSVKSRDVGALMGAGFMLGRNNPMSFVVETTYELGLAAIDNSPAQADVKNRAWGVTAGFAFKLSQGRE